MATILKFLDFLPKLFSFAKSVYKRIQKSRRIQREIQRRKKIDKAIKEDNEKLAKDVLSSTLSNIRRNLD